LVQKFGEEKTRNNKTVKCDGIPFFNYDKGEGTIRENKNNKKNRFGERVSGPITAVAELVPIRPNWLPFE